MALPGETISHGADDHSKDPNVTPLKVMMSAAGFYIGTGYIDPEFGHEEPNTRESIHYYATHKEAQHALDNNEWLRR